MASPTQWTWVCASSRSWWWTGSLACYSPWGFKELDMTEQLNWPDTCIYERERERRVFHQSSSRLENPRRIPASTGGVSVRTVNVVPAAAVFIPYRRTCWNQTLQAHTSHSKTTREIKVLQAKQPFSQTQNPEPRVCDLVTLGQTEEYKYRIQIAWSDFSLLKRHRFDPCVRKIPQSRKWQPALVFLPGNSHGQRSLAGYSPWGCKELDTTEWLNTHTINEACWFCFSEYPDIITNHFGLKWFKAGL